MASTDRSFSEVLKDIFGNFEDVLRSELKLAKRKFEMKSSDRPAAWAGSRQEW